MTRHKSQEIAEGGGNTEEKEKESQQGLTDDGQGRRRMEDSPESGHRTPEVVGEWKRQYLRKRGNAKMHKGRKKWQMVLGETRWRPPFIRAGNVGKTVACI